MAPRIDVVVLTWNGRVDTLACVESVLNQLAAQDRLWIVDNASTDGTEDALRAAFPADFTVGSPGAVPAGEIIQNGANLGFAAGNNPGLQRALDDGADWIFLLNNDTVVPAGAIESLRVLARDAAPDLGVLQPLLVAADEPSRIDSAGHQLTWSPGARDLAIGRSLADLPGQPIEVFGACGAAALLRREALLRAGLLDEALFVLLEDVDLMFRIRAHGFRVETVPAIRIRHHRGVSGSPRSPQRRFWAQRNIVALALRWWPWTALWVNSPLLAFRVVQALWFGIRHRAGRSGPLWRSALRSRRANRRAMRHYRVDRWFRHRPLSH